MERIKKMSYKGKEIIYVNYNGLNEQQMISLMDKHKSLILNENRSCLFLADFSNARATPGYLKEADSFIKSTRNLVKRGAFIGVDAMKRIILNSVIKLYKVNYKAFETREKALEALVS
jgi:hypothetical protein